MTKQIKLYGYILIVAMVILTLLLWWEHRMLKKETEKLLALQDHYYSCVEGVKRVLRAQQESSSCDEEASAERCPRRVIEVQDADDIVWLNRGPRHLKEAAISFFKAQKQEKLLNQLDESVWDDHGTHTFAPKRIEQKIYAKLPANKPVSRQSSRSRRPTYLRLPSKNIFDWPIRADQFWLSSFFGPRKTNGRVRFHYGIDMAAVRGTPVRAAEHGTVERAGYQAGYGNTVLISHGALYKTRYAHLHSIAVKPFQKVKAGQLVGSVGDTGYTIKSGRDASHLHFEVYERGKQVNPLAYLKR